MATFNKVFLIGNLTKDPELRYTPQGRAVTTLRVAANRNFRTKTGEDRKETCFVNVVTWANLAEICNQYLQKGKSVFVEGRLQSRNWQDAQGKNRTTIEVIAEKVQFLSPRSQTQEVDLGSEPQVEETEFNSEERTEIEA
ncbi:MAG: single-stranded DNA-binding protein [Candidatus Omnitrophica bacterium]|nr:single-stranded DNA-binding protein [Candidatus Omnitrophota bacterium]